jgi:uncharacterized membrane protein YfcA
MPPALPPDLAAWQWVLLALGATAIGMSKTGLPGLGALYVALFANLLSPKASVGVVLPLLILGDAVALAVYRRDCSWPHVLRVFPWAAVGVGLGWWALGRLSDVWAARTIGGLLLALVLLHVWRQRRPADTAPAPARPVAAATGLLAGFATLMANAAGPVMTIYLLAMRLPKREFLGTAAVFFFVVNWFKVPFLVDLGLIHTASLKLDLALAPAVLLGAWLGRGLAQRIDQRAFEAVSLALAALAAARLLLAG